MKLKLRRTLVRSIILVITLDVHDWLRPLVNVVVCSAELQSVEVSDTTGDEAGGAVKYIKKLTA